MVLHLPAPIAIYFAAEDAEACGRCLAHDAVVHDERRTIEGIAAIVAWRAESRRKYNHTVEVLDVAERDGKTVVTAKVSGNFPGSPVNLDYAFGLRGDKIASLAIA